MSYSLKRVRKIPLNTQCLDSVKLRGAAGASATLKAESIRFSEVTNST
ncbi:hypothetical protein [Neorhodopirellula lusitana]